MNAIYCQKCLGLIEPNEGYTGHYCACKKDNKHIGWECPRCHKIHSPYSMTCDCLPIGINQNTIYEAPIYKELGI